MISTDQIGASLAKFEAVAGKPTGGRGGLLDYRVDGCDISIIAERGVVSYITLELSKTCHPKDVLGGISDWTFAGIEKRFGGGRYGSSCLKACGNAYDPDIYLVIHGGASDGVDVSVRAARTSDPIIEASNRWATVIEKAEGEDYLIENKFDCGKYDDLAHRLFGMFQVSSISIGSVGGMKCD